MLIDDNADQIQPTWAVSLNLEDPCPPGLAKILGDVTEDETVEPPTKRRKLLKASLKEKPELDPTILLRRLTIRLNFSPQSGRRTDNHEMGSSRPRRLHVESVRNVNSVQHPKSTEFKSSSQKPILVDSESDVDDADDSLELQYSVPHGGFEVMKLQGDSLSSDIDIPAILEAAVTFQKASTKRLCLCTFSVFSTNADDCNLQLDIRWRNSKLFTDIPTESKQFELLSLITSDLTPRKLSAWSPRDFYDSVHVPDKHDKTHERLSVTEIQSTLFGYQKRAVEWMLKREGVNIDGFPLVHTDFANRNAHGWSGLIAADGQSVSVNQWLGLVSNYDEVIDSPYTRVSGGILAEEMGLGKTVEILAVLIKHKRDPIKEESITQGLTSTGATLIVAPESIITQWSSEIGLHAPSLRVLVYPGISKSGKQKEEELKALIQDSDVVLCSYNTLAREVHFAREPPKRNMRHERQDKHARTKSPLVQLHWWRCVLDECQMIQSGVSSAAEVALQIPRQHAWAVSGTPLRKDPGDVYGLLRFLQLLPYSWSSKTWSRLLDHFQGTFRDLIKEITLRHTKHLVKDEIELPPQKRIVSTVSLTQIEDQHYSNTFDRMCLRIGLDSKGAPLREDWDPNDPTMIEQMRSWLTRLRQLCLHPDVGGRNRQALGGRMEDVLRTVEDVLQVMTEQNEVALRADERSYIMARLHKGQLLEYEKKSQEALNMWQDALLKIKEVVKEARLLVEKATSESSEPGNRPGMPSMERSGNQSRLTQLRGRLRLALELEHMARFFIGNAYFQIKENKDVTESGSEGFQRLERLEIESYDAAKAIRVELLVEPRHLAQTMIDELSAETRWNSNTKKAINQGLPSVQENGGIESSHLFDDLDKLADQYNRLLQQIMTWRTDLISILSKPLVDQDDKEVEGDEYETSTKQQDEAYARMDIFRAAVTDLSEILTGQENSLIKTEIATWTKQAKEGKGNAPELMLELLQTRNQLKPMKNLGSIRGIVARLRSIRNNLRQLDVRRNLEAEVIGRVDGVFRQRLVEHEKVVTLLSSDVNSFINVQNARLEFYRQLQHISDLVAPWPPEEEVDETFGPVPEVSVEEMDRKLKKKLEQDQKRFDTEEKEMQISIEKKTSQARYLEHLKNASTLGEERKCIICQDDQYEIGILTACGHLFCKECMNAWLASHSKCPQCRATIKSRQELYQISYKPQQLHMEEEVTDEASHSKGSSDGREESPKLTSIYSHISLQQLNEIKSIDLAYNYSTKIDFIARHIIWLRRSDPGCKTVVFSQFRNFCPGRLAMAFDRLGIRYAVVGGKIGVERFKHDPQIECVLMHAGSQASGMNLVNASHVLLCEPLVNTALELQAIARVHRIGQHRATTIWMYLIEGTVEKAIYDLSVERRLEHIGKQNKGKRSDTGNTTAKGGDEDVQAVDAEEMNDKPLTTLLTKNKEGGEIVGKDDLWKCLFGYSRHRRELPLHMAVDGEGEDGGNKGSEVE